MIYDVAVTAEEMEALVFQAFDWCLEHGRTTSSARVLAGIICNRYNSDLFPEVELAGVTGTLDREHRRMAVAVICWAYEPHQAVKNGGELVHEIAKLYRIRKRRMK
jgi:hypothetical protein